MKILHTADWHLGKRLDRFSRLEEQTIVLEEMIALADEQQVDMVLIAGDLFDSFNPSIEATELFYRTLKRLTNNGKRPVVAIAGNHDAPDRIDAPDPLARECGIILIGHPNALVLPFETPYFQISHTDKGFIELRLHHIDFPIRILHTAYANEVRLKEYFGETQEIQLNLTLKHQWSELADKYCDKTGVNLLITHLYMNNRYSVEFLEEPEGEKPLRIGNADMVFTDCIPPQVQYTALGHLHGFNNIGTEEKPVVYSSSILCYSFSEAGQTKYVSMIDATPSQITFDKMPLRNGRALVRKTFSAVEDAVTWLENHPDTFVELTIESDDFLTATERMRIYQSHNGIVHLIPKVKNQHFDGGFKEFVNINQDINAIFKDYFKYKNGNQEPNEEMMELFNEILNYEKEQ